MDDRRFHPGALVATGAGKMGARVCLAAMWSGADWGSSSTGKHVLVWQSAATIGASHGADTCATKRRISGLVDAGFVAPITSLDQAAREAIGPVAVRSRGADGEAIFDKFGAPVFTRMEIKCRCGQVPNRCHCRVLAPVSESGELLSSLAVHTSGAREGCQLDHPSRVGQSSPTVDTESGMDGHARVVRLVSKDGTDGHARVVPVSPHQTSTKQDQTELTEPITPPAKPEVIAPPTPEASPSQSTADPPSTECAVVATGSTVDMFGTEPSAPGAKRDFAAEVFAHLRDRVIATKRDLGIKPAMGPRKLSPQNRKSIEARISDHGGGDEGLEACKRVIAIDEAECRAQGQGGRGWGYWNATTPFRLGNFDQRLGRWREDGNHALMTRGKTNGQRRGPNVSGYNLHEEFPCDGT